MRIAVTGRPGIGKTTLCLKVYEALKTSMSVGGFVTSEVRIGGRRTGFKLVELGGKAEAWLARVGGGDVRVGKYAVFVDELERFLDNLNLDCELLIIDEVGPMELKSKKFVEFVRREVLTRNNVLVSVHMKSRHPVAEEIRRSFKLYTLTEENRDAVAEEVIRTYDRGGKS